MLFKRRNKPEFWERARAWFWPKRGWRRAWGYVVHRVSRLSGTPHGIAIGFSAGAFSSFTPFVGFHFIIGFMVAWLARGSLVASALGTFIGNPFTFPLIWIMTYSVGTFLLGLEADRSVADAMPTISLMSLWSNPGDFWQDFWDRIWPVILPMLVGGLPLGILSAAGCYMPVKAVVTAYQAKRRERLNGNAHTAARAPEID